MGAMPRSPNSAQPSAQLSDGEFQAWMLQGVSRTFALTIPQLPPELARVVGNAYLLCRIVDTFEDEPALTASQKRHFCEQFVAVVQGETPAQQLSAELAPLLSQHTIPEVHQLIRDTPRVIVITHSFSEHQQKALATCVQLMGEGMVGFQENKSGCGLSDLAALDKYCYHVAGCVGEMLTKLFCDYSPAIARNREALMSLAVSFGQGLQMTNILKDIWDDRERGFCWLPQDVFAEAGFNLDELAPGRYNASFGHGLTRLIAIAHGHLKNALCYTLLIPANEAGIRNFCLWALGMAVLTLRKIHRHPDFRSGAEVKISRRAVKVTILASRLSAAHDPMLKSLFRLAALGLPPASYPTPLPPPPLPATHQTQAPAALRRL